MLLELMAVGGLQRQSIDAAQLFDLFQRRGRKRGFALEGVQNDSFQQIAQRHVFQLRQPLQDLEQAFLQANPSLDSLNQDGFLWVLTHPTIVPKYLGKRMAGKALRGPWEGKTEGATSDRSCADSDLRQAELTLQLSQQVRRMDRFCENLKFVPLGPRVLQ